MANLTAPMAGNPPATDASSSQATGQQMAYRRNFWIINGIAFYYLLMLFLAFRVLLDVWSGSYVIAQALGMQPNDLQDPLLKMAGFAAVGGTLGGIQYNMRQLYQSVKRKEFDRIWIGKYMTMPLESAGMAVIILALIQGGIAAVSGGGLPETGGNNFAPLGLGALVGMGTRDVVEWVNNIVQRLFSLEGDSEVKSEASGEESS
jgi:hypothetical protein